MKRTLLIALCALGFTANANAAGLGPDDLTAIGNNLGPTADALLSGLGDTANTLISTQSAVQTSAALGTTVVNTGTALVQGTSPSLAALTLALIVNNSALQQFGNPLLTAIDDPTAANLQNIADPNDLATIGNNLQPALGAVVNGDYTGPSSPNGTGGKAFLINLLQGNIYTGIINQGAAYYGLVTLAAPAATLIQGTQPGNALTTALTIDTIAPLIAGGSALEQIQPVTKQLADAGAPLTGPLVDAIAGVDTSGL